MQKTNLLLIMATCFFLIHLHFAQNISAEDVAGDPGSSQLTELLPGEGTPPGDNPSGTLIGDLPSKGGKASGGTSSNITKRDGLPIFDIGQSRENAALEKRISVLESTKQDLTLWITIFVTMVTILIALNVGLSVWQVGGIARREVEQRIKEFDDQFHGILSKDAQAIDEQIKSYESKILALTEKLEHCDSTSAMKLEQMNKALESYRTEANNFKSKFFSDSENLKESSLKEIENYYLKTIANLDEKLRKK